MRAAPTTGGLSGTLSISVQLKDPIQMRIEKMRSKTNREGVYQGLVSQARPSRSTAFSSFRINTQREGLAHAYTCLDTARQDVDWPIRFVENMITSH